MPPEDTNLFLEKAFQTLADVKVVNFDNCRGPYGWAAEKRGFSEDEDIGYLVGLIRRWGPKDNTKKMHEESNYHQYKATGKIGSLKFLTQTPSDDRKAKAKVITRLNYLDGNNIETIKERIKRAVETQSVAKKLLSLEDTQMKKMLNVLSALSYRSENLINYDDKDFNLIYDGRYAKPLITLARSEDGFSASTKRIEDIHFIVKPLQFQLERFEKLI